LAAYCYIGLVLTGILLGSPPASDKVTADRKRAEELVQRLGDQAFRVRDAAYRELIGIGGPAKAAVEKGLQDPDLDVHESCRRLLPQIRESYIHEQIEDFLSNPKREVPADLPGVKRWMEIAGDSKASRAMYAELVLKYHTLISEADSERGLGKFISFYKDCYDRRDGLAPEEMKLFLFLASNPKMRSKVDAENTTLLSLTYVFLESNSMRKILTEEEPSGPARKLFVAWLERESFEMVVKHGFRMAVELKIREVTPVALKIARDAKHSITDRTLACRLLGELATPDQLKEVAALTGDDTPVESTGAIVLGDVAMATILRAGKQELEDYGYNLLMLGTGGVPYRGFNTEENRRSAREKFAKWWAEEQKKK